MKTIKKRNIINYYVGHEVSDKIKERVLKMISTSRDDEELNAAYRDLWNDADSAYMEEKEISAAYERILKNEDTKSTKFRIPVWTRIVAVLVPLLLLIVFGKLYVQMSSQLKEAQAICMLQEHTINDEAKIIALSDGSKIKLGQSSVLLHPNSFRKAKERRVFLIGEAFFDIKHNDKQPFRVCTPYFEITDMGTSFAVSSYTDEDVVSTTLKTGKIAVRIIGNNGKIYNMSPNERLVYNVKTKVASIRKVSSYNDGFSWRNKAITLNDVTIANMANVFGEAYDVRFSFLSDHHKNTRITIHLNYGETLEGAMAIVKELVPDLEYELKDNEVVVK